ncbi:ATP-binding cassette domain-containing protein [Sulfurovum sp. bin170]|uniref:thiamine ABC transporter ATP-binding protein n=1 Tax=Sulfurovum sp. bin170 TaxID=2695268 RepID=UPI0013E00F32|nr:ATP-binding cassette domain-containing protein [Sulfurovum sp. bin170]NEW60452.1 ATP-binding cassette domain-containing protein [Sulfurovum sp. bin170]
MLKVTDLKYQYSRDEGIPTYKYSIEVKEQEIVALLGESGSGKSTLLDLIAGFLDASSGTIELNGDDFTNRAIEKRPISILFQNHNLFEHLSVEKNILLGISKTLKDSMGDIEKVKKILKEVGLEKFKKTIVSSLSGGQQQRVALARVLLRVQPILLLDEPFTGLDAKTRLEMLKLVKQITLEKSLCTIMVTHEIEDCKLIANRVYKVENSELAEQ